MITAREMHGRMPVRGKVQDGVQGRDQIQEVDLPGVTPSRQKRSREMKLALLQAGALAGLCGIRNHEGVLRATLQHGGARPDRWTPFKHRGRAMTERATSLLLAAMGNGREAAKRRSIAFGFQLVFGTLVNAILNDPGPISLCDPEMEARLGRCLLQTLQAEMTAPPARRGRHAPR
jgi:hypothetical protein